VIELDDTSGTPPFEQVRDRVTALVDSGDLAAGDRLPTVRGLADQLGVAPGTVARAYRDLERAGVIETRGRAGSFVTGDGVARRARTAALDYLAETAALGLTPDEAVALLAEVRAG
jgi:DNA-binding transcriptional regulator YhcF (GntR family)